MKRAGPALISTGLLAGCNGHQSTLATFGAEAAEIRTMAIILLCGAITIAMTVFALYVQALRSPENGISHKQGMRLVLWAGAIVPTVTLTALLLLALPAMRPMKLEPEGLTIRVEGEQFWWRVIYEQPDASRQLVDANEVRIPVGRNVAFQLTATDVLHSFWIPGLAGKMDMIPGRLNQLVVRAERPGRYRGVCAEFCGLSHALMAFDVIAMEQDAFDRWISRQRQSSPGVANRNGAEAFAEHGCGGCHTIRGTEHTSRIGPNLSRFGDHVSLGAGIMQPSTENIAAFIRDPHEAKPGARMPAFPQITEKEATDIARYLKGLK